MEIDSEPPKDIEYNHRHSMKSERIKQIRWSINLIAETGLRKEIN
jgi:hypothetical protein